MEIVQNDRREGERARDEALDLLRLHRHALVRETKRLALRLAFDLGEVSADEVRGRLTIPAGIKPAFVGCAFKDLAARGLIRSTKFRQTNRAVAHARPLRVWVLADAHGAADELRELEAQSKAEND